MTTGGASREALATARERLDALADSTPVDIERLAGELTAVTALLDREVSLRRILTDPAQDGQAKTDLLRRILTGRVGEGVLDLLGGLVRSRWSQPRDLVDTMEELAAIAELIGAQRAGRLDDVEDELFRFGRIVQSSPDLRSALGDRVASDAAKASLVRSLLDGRAHPVTERLVTRLVSHPRGRSLSAGLEAYSKLAAARRGRVVATVTTAAPLSDRQKARLGAALGKLLGHKVHMNLDVDPQVLGGISVRVGDEIIDGLVTSRLDEAARRLAG